MYTTDFTYFLTKAEQVANFLQLWMEKLFKFQIRGLRVIQALGLPTIAIKWNTYNAILFFKKVLKEREYFIMASHQYVRSDAIVLPNRSPYHAQTH